MMRAQETNMADIETILADMRSGGYRAQLYEAFDRLVQGKSRYLIDAREDTTIADLMLSVAEDLSNGWISKEELANGRND
jgi:hypothetical protein